MLVLEVGGVGYEIEVTTRIVDEIAEPGGVQRLHTHLIVREDSQKLVGFIDIADRDLFRVALRADGVGPAMAMALLSTFTPAELAEHAHSENHAALSRVPGIGKKTAAKLCFNLKDKLSPGAQTGAGAATGNAASNTISDSVARALVQQLGFNGREARQLVASSVSPEMDFEQALQAALRASTGANA